MYLLKPTHIGVHTAPLGDLHGLVHEAVLVGIFAAVNLHALPLERAEDVVGTVVARQIAFVVAQVRDLVVALFSG